MLYKFALSGIRNAQHRIDAEEAIALIDEVHAVKAWDALMLVEADLPRAEIVHAVNQKLELLQITAVLR